MEDETNEILQSFHISQDKSEKFEEYFKKIKENFSELGYGKRHESLKSIYKDIFTNIEPEFVEKVKGRFFGCSVSNDGLNSVSDMINEIGSMNELLHAMHSSIVNNDTLLKSMPVVSKKENSFKTPITLYGEDNEISHEIFEKFPEDLEVGDTQIISMKDETIMMIRDIGHSLTIELTPSEKEKFEINYFIPKICNEKMVRALKGINTSSITENGAVGMFDLEKENITDLFDFISKVPSDEDMLITENSNVDKEVMQMDDNSNNINYINDEENQIFTMQDVRELSKGRKVGKIEGLINKFKEYMVSKNDFRQKGDER